MENRVRLCIDLDPEAFDWLVDEAEKRPVIVELLGKSRPMDLAKEIIERHVKIAKARAQQRADGSQEV